MSLQQADGRKVPKDAVLRNRLFEKLSVTCRHNTGSSHEFGAYLIPE